jgi:hypothetical protein
MGAEWGNASEASPGGTNLIRGKLSADTDSLMTCCLSWKGSAS